LRHRPLWEETNLGNRLNVSIPRLTPEDIMLMEAFQQRVLTERTVLLSYICTEWTTPRSPRPPFSTVSWNSWRFSRDVNEG
jgi:hypothetical protein